MIDFQTKKFVPFLTPRNVIFQSPSFLRKMDVPWKFFVRLQREALNDSMEKGAVAMMMLNSKGLEKESESESRQSSLTL